MASSSDIRDIMDMGRDGPKPPALKKKKKKIVETHPRLSGISREVQALMGDSVPPVSIIETPKYKSRPSLAMRNFKPRHWEERQFQHGARSDGLILTHWKRSLPRAGQRPPPQIGIVSDDTEMVDSENAPSPAMELRFEDEFAMDKWNIRIEVPSYTEEQYEKNLKSDEWTKEETDYLLQLARDFDLRWMLIADRYSPEEITQPSITTEQPSDSEIVKRYPDRTMEALKSRYYQIAAKDLESKTPASNMTQTEFQLWERMKNFDAKTETTRKMMAEKLFERTKDEAEEERTLLEELYRITKHEEDFIKMRKDLYTRLESVPSLRRNERGEEQNMAFYQTSTGLSTLLHSLLKKENRLRRPIAPGEGGAAAAPTPTDNRRQPHQAVRRDTADTHAGDSGHQKKASVSQPIIRQLNPSEEVKYGVSHPSERLTSGVSFRHEKINRLSTAKSQVQTQKINDVLTQLEIPARLSMPTERVCKEYERLVHDIQLLIDAKKATSKVSEEVKILEAMRRQRLGEPAEGDTTRTDGENGADAAHDEKPSMVNGTKQSANSMDVKNGSDEMAIDKDENTELQIDESMMQDADDANSDAEENEKSGVALDEADDDEEDEEDAENDMSYSRQENGEDEEEEEEEEEDEDQTAVREEEDEEEDEDADQDSEDENLAALRRSNAENDEEDDEEDEEEEEEEDEEEEDEREDKTEIEAEADEEEDDEEEENDEADEEDDQAEVDVSVANGDDGDEAEDDEEEEEATDDQPSRPTSSGSAMARSHKRSASVVSNASRAGSNRSGIGRKRKR